MGVCHHASEHGIGLGKALCPLEFPGSCICPQWVFSGRIKQLTSGCGEEELCGLGLTTVIPSACSPRVIWGTGQPVVFLGFDGIVETLGVSESDSLDWEVPDWF